LIKGIGPVYRDRLTNSGIHSFSDLASADTDNVAEITKTSVSVAHGWVQSAQSQV
jgi:predicted flap endonuclease-1-like 5' DNA nuclease